jgi:hypothetical protein
MAANPQKVAKLWGFHDASPHRKVQQSSNPTALQTSQHLEQSMERIALRRPQVRRWEDMMDSSGVWPACCTVPVKTSCPKNP